MARQGLVVLVGQLIDRAWERTHRRPRLTKAPISDASLPSFCTDIGLLGEFSNDRRRHGASRAISHRTHPAAPHPLSEPPAASSTVLAPAERAGLPRRAIPRPASEQPDRRGHNVVTNEPGGAGSGQTRRGSARPVPLPTWTDVDGAGREDVRGEGLPARRPEQPAAGPVPRSASCSRDDLATLTDGPENESDAIKDFERFTLPAVSVRRLPPTTPSAGHRLVNCGDIAQSDPATARSSIPS